MVVKCPNCSRDLAEDTKFCPSCGSEIVIEAKPRVSAEESGDSANLLPIMCFMFAFMIFFFALVPIFLGSWIGAGIMAAAGMLLIIVGAALYRSHKKEVKEERAQAAIRIKCRYCGSLNAQNEEKCVGCGAPL